ncbi:GMC oxidoreductase [Mycena polygramma]|nr:GMC oxidoreductase [Mycena polygramma]
MDPDMNFSFDYVVVGGGTAGLALAARLAEDASVSVCVLEAGKDQSQNEDIKTPGKWEFPKPGASERLIYSPRGKGLGGSIGHAALESSLGATEWNAAEFLKYFKKSQHLSKNQPKGDPAYPLAPDPALYGDGPIPNTVPVHTPAIAPHYYAACAAAGLPFNPAGGNGNNGGVWPALVAVDPKDATRVSAETAYLAPMRGSKNLTVITEARATRILFNGRHATSVQFQDQTESAAGAGDNTVQAKKEIIVCGGAFHTPRLLELSGIGVKGYIPEGVAQVVDLPGVGCNLLFDAAQDHTSVLTLCETDPRIDSYDLLEDPIIAARLMEEYKMYGTGPLSTPPLFCSFLPLKAFMAPVEIAEIRRLADLAILENTGITSARTLELLKKWLHDDESYQIEMIIMPMHVPLLPGGEFVPGKRYLFFSTILMHPFSRGSAHASASGAHGLEVDLGLLGHTIDVQILAAGVQFARKIIEQEPLAGTAGVRPVAPPVGVLDAAAAEAWVRRVVSNAYHPLGTAAMLPREEGGVVDSTLKVYGTENLRVVDASVIPLQLSCHPMGMVYAIAEKAADMIKAEVAKAG